MALVSRSTNQTIWFFYLLLWSAAFLCTKDIQLDPDVWGHVKFGIDILQTGNIARIDPYSYLTTGTPWINHEWLSELIFGIAYTYFGHTAGLVTLRFLLIAAILGIIFWQLLRYRIPTLLGGSLFLIALLELNPGTTSLRPQIFTYLLFACELLLLQAFDYSGKWRQLWLLPPLFALWMNLHGGVLAGLAVFLFFCGSTIVKDTIEKKDLFSALKKNSFLLFIGALSLIAILFTPFGFELVSFLLKTATVARSEISEWQPLQLVSQRGFLYALSIVYAGWVSWSFFFKKRPVSNSTMLLCLALPFSAERHLPLAALAITLLPMPDLGDYLENHSQLNKFFSLPQAGKSNIVLSALAIIGSIVMIGLAITVKPLFVTDQEMPVRAVQLLRQSGVKGNLICYFDWGEYCIWHLFPNIKVSIDGRRETIYKPEVYKQNLDFTYGEGDKDALLHNQHPNLILINRFTASADTVKANPEWRLVYQNRAAAVFARANSIEEKTLRYTLAANPRYKSETCEPIWFP